MGAGEEVAAMRFSEGSMGFPGGLSSRIGKMFEAAGIAILVFAALTASAFGEGAKPFRAARLTYLQGEVRVELANSTANSVAVVNMPLVEGTVISSGADGQAEIEFEDGSLARITPNSGLSLVNLSVDSSGTYQTRIAVLGGLAYLELRAGTKYVYSVDAGGEIISPVENATVRVSLDEPPAAIAVLDGAAHVASGGSSVDATAGQTVQADAQGGGGVLITRSAIAPESWDRWNEDRDEAAAGEEGTQTDVRSKFAGSQGYGWSDLDANGSWYDVPGQGQVWQPDLAAAAQEDGTGEEAGNQGASDGGGFDPYGYGSWAWTPAGYSWASGYGWGWLPYRCGQWAYYDGFGWGWSPSPFCAVIGFGGYGYGGYGFRFGNLPPGYRRPRRPVPGPGPVHPILRGRGGEVPVAPVHRPGVERVIAGNRVQPLEPVGSSGFVAGNGLGGGALGAGLRRDYPVDTKTHAPVMGVIAAHGAPANGLAGRPGWQPRQGYPQRPVYGSPAGGLGQSGVQPARGGYQPGGSGFAPVERPAQSAPIQRQVAPSAPRYSPPPTPASHSAPAAAPSAAKGK